MEENLVFGKLGLVVLRYANGQTDRQTATDIQTRHRNTAHPTEGEVTKVRFFHSKLISR